MKLGIIATLTVDNPKTLNNEAIHLVPVIMHRQLIKKRLDEMYVEGMEKYNWDN